MLVDRYLPGLVLSVLMGTGPAFAEAADGPPRQGSWISEVKGGVLLHDATRNSDTRTSEKDTIDLHGEVIFKTINIIESDNWIIQKLFQVRPHLGGQINTSDQTHQIYTGVTLGHQFQAGLFVDFSFGLTAHTGQLESHDPGNDRPNLGSPILFREALDLGYRFKGGHGVSVYGVHMSHANLFADENDSMNFVGLRYGYRMD